MNTYKHKINKHLRFIKLHWKIEVIVLSLIIVIVQFIYPTNLMTPFSVIDNVAVGGLTKNEAILKLDSAYKSLSIPIYFGTATKPNVLPHPADIGLDVDSLSQINQMDYPWYLRIIPGSILWVHFINDGQYSPKYTYNETTLDEYISNEFDSFCNTKRKSASLKVDGQDFKLIEIENYTTCETKNVRDVLIAARPNLSGNFKVSIPINEVSDAYAQKYGEDLKNKIKNGVTVSVGDSSQKINSADLIDWIEFYVSKGALDYLLNTDKASGYMNSHFASKVAVAAGTTTISTRNLIETSRVTGSKGKILDIEGTLSNIKSFIDGKISQAKVATTATDPNIVYKHSYSSNDKGLSALMQQYDADHNGTFGVSMIELAGKNRRAGYNDTRSFTTASTYKLFVAYSTLKRIENGTWHWDDANIALGRNLATCFEYMIARSDNACAESLLNRIGYQTVTNEAQAIGCKNTSFVGDGAIRTTPADLALFLGQLKMGQILTLQTSRDRLIEAMTHNVYRLGIPSGLTGMTVADKVGFLWGLLHDAAIVYSPTGAYVLIVMTDGSTWANIAELASQIEALRTQ